MAFKFKEASSSLCPPDKNMTPTHEGTTDLDKATTVLNPISSAVTVDLFSLVDPGVTILGFKSIPSKNTLLSAKALKTA